MSTVRWDCPMSVTVLPGLSWGLGGWSLGDEFISTAERWKTDKNCKSQLRHAVNRDNSSDPTKLLF